MKKAILILCFLSVAAVVHAQAGDSLRTGRQTRTRAETDTGERAEADTRRQAGTREKVLVEADTDIRDPVPDTAQPKHEGAHMAFDALSHDFGDIDHRSKQIGHSFEFTNDGSEPLVITRTLTSCSCIKITHDKKPVPPGGRGTISVVYEVSKKEPGVFYKTIEIYSNSVDKRNNLIIKGNAVK